MRPAAGVFPLRSDGWRMSTAGAAPWSSGHSAGRPISSPSLSRVVMSSTVTGGRAPGRERDLRLFFRRPSSSKVLSRSLSSTRASPFSPKALAISRLDARSGFSVMNSSKTSRGGTAPWMMVGPPKEGALSLRFLGAGLSRLSLVTFRSSSPSWLSLPGSSAWLQLLVWRPSSSFPLPPLPWWFWPCRSPPCHPSR